MVGLLLLLCLFGFLGAFIGDFSGVIGFDGGGSAIDRISDRVSSGMFVTLLSVVKTFLGIFVQILH